MSRKTTTGIGIEILRNYFRDHKRENDFLILPRPEFEKNRRGDYLLIEIIVAGSIYLLTREEMKEITDKGIYGIGAVTALTQRPIWPNNIQPPFWETNLLPILLTQDAVALQARLRAALRQVLVPVGASILIANQVKK